MWLPSRRVWLYLCCVCLIALGGARAALADVAPPEQLPGSDIGPGGATQVRMLSERIVIDVQAIPRQEASTDKPPMQAQVRGSFTMRNLGDANEHMQVRFPRGDPRGNSHARALYQEVQQFTAQVGGLPVATTLITSTNPGGADKPPVEWLAFDVDFPVGQDVVVDVGYLIAPTQYLTDAFGSFAYVLQTGAGWRDSIGSAEIMVRLPYPATAENVRLGLDAASGRDSTPGATLDGNEVRWSFRNLEPTERDDIFVRLMVPRIWQGIADARAAAAAKPKDVPALVRLAAAYDAAAPFFASDDPFANLSEQSYAQAVEIQPDSAQLHADYAALIWKHNTTQALLDDVTDPEVLAEVQHALMQISLALARDPQQRVALGTLADMQSMSRKPLALPKVTPTPTPTNTLVPTNTPAPTNTIVPTNTPAPPAGGEAGSGWLMLGGGVIIGAVLGGGAAYGLARRRRA